MEIFTDNEYDYENIYSTSPTKIAYQKISKSNEYYIAYVVAVQNPLNLHLHIYWPEEIEKKYIKVKNYIYDYISEEFMINDNNIDNDIRNGTVYSCHLKGIEIINDNNYYALMKECYIYMIKKIQECRGWILISVSDIDVYSRILINVYDIITKKCLNKELLEIKHPKLGCNIVKEYVRPLREKQSFSPKNIPNIYHIIYNKK